MLLANAEVGTTFRFRDNGEYGSFAYTKVGPDHIRRTSAGIHGCCIPLESLKMEEINVIKVRKFVL